MKVKRREMLPGDIFVFYSGGDGLRPATLVVLDAKREIEFWYGGRFFVGNIAPGLEFEVLS